MASFKKDSRNDCYCLRRKATDRRRVPVSVRSFRALELPYYEYEEFNLAENISEAECKAEFQFEKGDIERLADVLQLPPTFECPQGSVCDRIEGLCIFLRRIAYPCRYSDMFSRFARPVPVLCMISNIGLYYIYDLH